MNYAKLFTTLRAELNLNQVEMAKKLRCTQGALSKIEKGKMKPNVEVFIRVCRLITQDGVSDELFFKFLGEVHG